MNFNIFILVMWIIVGICNVISCVTGAEARWFTYWLCYVMCLICLIKDIV